MFPIRVTDNGFLSIIALIEAIRELSFFSSRGGCGRNGMKDSVKFLIPPPWKQQKNC